MRGSQCGYMRGSARRRSRIGTTAIIRRPSATSKVLCANYVHRAPRRKRHARNDAAGRHVRCRRHRHVRRTLNVLSHPSGSEKSRVGRRLHRDSARELPDVRAIIVRAKVGAAGRIVQRAQLTTHQVVIDLATLIFVQSGQKRICWAEGDCVANPGDAIALSGGQLVDITNTPEHDGTYGAQWISWDGSAVDSFLQTASSIVPASATSLLPQLEAEFRIAYQTAFDSLLNVDGVPPSVAEHRLKEVLLWLHERGVSFHTPQPDNLSLRLRRLIQDDPAHEWSIDEVARRARSSPATLRRHLASERITFRDVLQDVRMSHALAILQNTDTSILSVASAVGYDSASRFAARFRTRFGYLPSEIRGHKRRDAGSVA